MTKGCSKGIVWLGIALGALWFAPTGAIHADSLWRPSPASYASPVAGAASFPLARPHERVARADRLHTITFYSPALGGAAHADILLPDGYASSSRRYPVLYLLAGHAGTYGQWVANGDVISLTQGLPLIVVMPDGLGGWYANPANGVGPRWEDYILDDLIPYVDGRYRTVAARAGRAVAGLSMGGLGAFDLAARHPDIAVAAASFSGSLDLLSMESAAWRTAFPDLAVFGDPSTDGWYWEGHDPVELASNLRGIRLYMASGDGYPGPFEPHGHSPDPDPGEQNSEEALQLMAAALGRAGIPATIENYGAGVHTWPYWQRDLRQTLPLIMDAFAHPPAPPVPWSYRTVDRQFHVWGYQALRTGGVPGWVELRDVTPGALSVDGTGYLTLLTAPLYRPGALYTVTIDGVRGAATADGTGRLRVSLDLLGPATARRVTIAP